MNNKDIKFVFRIYKDEDSEIPVLKGNLNIDFLNRKIIKVIMDNENHSLSEENFISKCPDLIEALLSKDTDEPFSLSFKIDSLTNGKITLQRFF